MIKIYLIIGAFILAVSVAFLKYQCEAHENKKGEYYRCTGGKYAGIIQEFKTWRKIAQQEARRQKNNRLEVLAQLGTDDEVNGVLYILGIELEKV